MNERIPADGCSGNGGGGGGGDNGDDVYENCEDTNWRADGSLIGDVDNDPCSLYTLNPGWCGTQYDTNEFISREMCCVCGGGRPLDDNGDDDNGDDGNGDDGGDGGNNQSV